ncbi:NADP-dependent oxidoreductase [Pseudalkalibacillus caeni]|uniref:NADP-dependent oxidoreductase n=1 Tax=Exobacillus caeni TaxID=2574798 RepID=A0A5R9F1W9_9BACL|nr:NADP-dependent oxidoreductase [Pseudalkalibacillus caeni]TLS37577.1 NADP-dependent oxidoreductase [Pseudalkalibacillus caeni]
MKAIVIEQYGGKDQLKEKEVPIPDVKENQVLVETHATSINPIDWKVREGNLKEMLPFDFPIILGWDVAGVIKHVGDKVENFEEGDRVFARPATTANGSYAEYVSVDEDLLAGIPSNISFEEAASVPLAGLTAWQCLVDFGNIKKGDRVLIHAGAGGVGTFGIQFAKHFGAEVATTASEKNIDFLRSLGADTVINYKEQDFEKELSDFDIVLDSLGGEIQQKSYNVLKKGGRLVSIVAPPDEEEAKEHGIKAGFLWLEPNGSQLQEIADLMEKRAVKPNVGHTFKFSESGLQQAHELSESHHAKGKIVISVK